MDIFRDIKHIIKTRIFYRIYYKFMRQIPDPLIVHYNKAEGVYHVHSEILGAHFIKFDEGLPPIMNADQYMQVDKNSCVLRNVVYEENIN
jgi:hypothetical protein